jgi:hypothetical protein
MPILKRKILSTMPSTGWYVVMEMDRQLEAWPLVCWALVDTYRDDDFDESPEREVIGMIALDSSVVLCTHDELQGSTSWEKVEYILGDETGKDFAMVKEGREEAWRGIDARAAKKAAAD